MSILVEEVRAYLSKSACRHPKERCRIDVIFGDYDRDLGYLLLECQFEYSPISESQRSYRGECQEISEIYEMIAEEDTSFMVKCFGGESPIIFGIGVMGGQELVKRYSGILNCILNPFLVPGLEDAVGIVNRLIAQIAQEYPTVNDRAQIGVVDEKGYVEIDRRPTNR